MEFLLKQFLGIPFYCFKLCVCVHVCVWVRVCIVPVETRGIRHCGAEVSSKYVYVHVCVCVWVCVCVQCLYRPEASDTMELRSQVNIRHVWVQRVEPRVSKRAAGVPSY